MTAIRPYRGLLAAADLQALIERVEKATGPDRELDAEIYMALRPYADTQAHMAAYASDPDAYWYWMASRDYTASVDAALALTVRLGLPWMAIMREAVRRTRGSHIATLPLAIIAATLRAMQQENE